MISVIVPLYNKKKAIGRCIQSVKDQTFEDWELIIVNDGSTDDSHTVVEKFLDDDRIKYLSKKNGGVSSARNYGVKHSIGEWIVFLDADDYMLNDALMILYNAAINNHAKISVANYYTETSSIRSLPLYRNKDYIIKSNYRDWCLRHYFICPGNSLFYRTIIEQHKFNEKLSRYEDVECFLNVIRNNKIAYSGQCVMVYSIDYNDLSHKATNIYKDFIFNMCFKGKSFWEKMILAKLLNSGFALYPEKCELLKQKYGQYLYLTKIHLFLFYCKGLYSKLFLFKNT